MKLCCVVYTMKGLTNAKMKLGMCIVCVCVSGGKKCKFFGKFCVRTKWMIAYPSEYRTQIERSEDVRCLGSLLDILYTFFLHHVSRKTTTYSNFTCAFWTFHRLKKESKPWKKCFFWHPEKLLKLVGGQIRTFSFLGDRGGGRGGCPMRGRSENLNFLNVGLPYECGVKFLRGGSYPSAIVAHCNNTRASWATDMENCVSEKTDYRKISRDER